MKYLSRLLMGVTEGAARRLSAIEVDLLIRATPFVVLTTSGLVLFDSTSYQGRAGDSGRRNVVISITIATIAAALPLAVGALVPAWHRLRSVLRRLPPDGARSLKSLVLSLHLAILLLAPAAHLAMAPGRYTDVQWYRYGFVDKRWIFALYWITVLLVLVLPPLIHRLLGLGRLEVFPEIRREATAETSPTAETHLAWKLVAAMSLSFFFFGPPWNIERTPLYVDLHEQVHLGPLQAIHRGSLPNVGPAAQQYGPGTQAWSYAFMKLSDEFTLVGFRKAQGAMFFASFTLYGVIAITYLGFTWGGLALILILSLSSSPFSLAYWNELGGFANWGWPNPSRYLGALFLVLAVASILTKHRSRGPIDARVVGIGWLWGLSTWISPENLMMGAVASGLLAGLLWATETVTLGESARVGVNVLLGGALFWLPILAFYTLEGRLSEYVENVFSVGSYVLAGYSNIPTSGSITNEVRNSVLFYGFLPVALLIGFVLLHDELALRRPLSWQQTLPLALVCASVASFFGALTRTDIYHVLNTMAAFPLLLVSAMRVVPLCVSGTALGRFLVRAGLVTFTFLAAFLGYGASWYSSRLSYPLAKYFETRSTTAVPERLRGGSFERTGYRRLPRGIFLEASVTPRDLTSVADMSEYFTMLDSVVQKVRGRVTYIHSLPGVEPGFGYFFGDVQPAPVLTDPSTMVVSSEIRARFLEHFETVLDDIGCVVATGSESSPAELELFLQSERNVVHERIGFRGEDIHIACK